MLQNALAADVKLQFSGHETFPLRYGWLKKTYDAVRTCELKQTDTKTVFSADDAIARFGVGKNMVASMRYWAFAAGILEEVRAHLGPCTTTPIGQALLDDDGWDPWLEDPNSLWLLHWHFASTPDRTSTWFWVFNHCSHATFGREFLVDHLSRLSTERHMKKVAPATLKRDVECFIRTYVQKASDDFMEDTLECPLTELSLLRTVGRKEGYHLARGPKTTLSPALFAFATAQYWQRQYPNVRTLSFDALFYGPGSPGRVFLLDEESIVDLAIELEVASDGVIAWSETAGLRQLICRANPTEIDPMPFLSEAYSDANRWAARG